MPKGSAADVVGSLTSAATLGQTLGLSERRVHELRDEGGIPDAERGQDPSRDGEGFRFMRRPPLNRDFLYKTVERRLARAYITLVHPRQEAPMLTPFGTTLRKLRLDKGMRLLDLARRLGVSSAQVSAVEIGTRAIQPGYVEQVIAAMDLTVDQAEELQRAADKTRAEVRIDHLPMNQRELVAAFARKVDEMPPDFMEQLRKKVLKSVWGEVPFRRKRRGALVAGQSTADLRRFAEQIRNVFVTPETVEFPIMDVLEFRLEALCPGFVLVPRGRDWMGDDEGRVIPGINAIFLREDVYDGAWDGNGRDRYTACHELCHYLVHRSAGFARTREEGEPMYRDAEWQADTFGGALLMSARHASTFSSVNEAAGKCGMTPYAARVMLSKYGLNVM